VAALDLNEPFASLVPFGLLVGLIILAFGITSVIRVYIVRIARKVIQKIPNLWVQTVLDNHFISKLAWILPVAVVLTGVYAIPDFPPQYAEIVNRIAQAALIFVALRVLTIFLWNINAAYSSLDVARDRPIKGIIQVALIILHLFALILAISVLLDKSPWIFLSGLGAMTAILLVIFRDTLLSLVAGFQLTTNNFIRVGDWIEMPQFSADGDVIDISLHAVRVQNWDKTITVIPTHKFLEHSFKNWRGMSESGGRRIKRPVQIDMSTIRFLEEEEIQKLSRFVLLREYMENKIQELKEYNRQYQGDRDLIINSRRLTNIGTFRAYLIAYLRQHPKIHQDLTFLVRQLPPRADGLPIEIYVFTNDIRWSPYEEIQADIFDHILAIANEFGLRIFQNPSGYDFQVGLKS